MRGANREMLVMCSFPFCARMMPIIDRVAEERGMTRRFGIHWTRHFLRCAGFKYRAASGGTKKTTDPTLLDMHMDKIRLRLVHYVTE